MYFELSKRIVVSLALLLLISLALPGCSHQVLTFFFTGVPEPGQEDAAALDSAVKPKKRVRVVKSSGFVHGPYGAGSCNLCHQSAAGSVFGQQATAATSEDSRRISPRLLQPLAELCVGCHSEHQPSAARVVGLWQHGPVANQQCTVCHSPHKSNRRYLLLANSNVAMCGQCHSNSDLRHTPQHSDDPTAECTGCHNPHSGQNRFLLKAEYDERSRFDES